MRTRGTAFFLTVSAAVCIVVLGGSFPAFGLDIQEGQWEVESETKMEGMAFDMPVIPTKNQTCITKETAFPKEQDISCNIKSQNISGNSVKWTVTCNQAGIVSETVGEITYSNTSFSGRSRTTAKGNDGTAMTMTSTMKGKYLGPCPAGTAK